MPEPKKVTLTSGKTRYRAVVDIGTDPETGKRRQVTVTRDTRREVTEEVARLQNNTANGTTVFPSRITLAEWLDKWMERKAEDLEESSLSGYHAKLNRLTEKLGAVQLQKLTEDHLDEWVAWMLAHGRKKGGKAGTGVRPTTVSQTLSLLREALRDAERRHLVGRNVAAYVKVPRRAVKADRKNNRREIPWSVEEVKSFLKGIKEDRLFPCVLLSLMGLRPGEVCGIRWSDIDFELGTLSVENNRTMVNNGRVIEKDTKTYSGTRVLPLPSPVLAALMAFQVNQEAEKVTAGDAYADTGYVLVDELGQPYCTRTLRVYAYKLMDSTNLRRVRLYDARHSCLSYLSNKVPDNILAAWAGHTNATFTKRVYVHPSPEELKAAADHLDDLFS